MFSSRLMLCFIAMFYMMMSPLVSNAQTDHVVLEDDEYNFSIMTQAVMTMKPDTLKGQIEIPYRVYDGSKVTEKDTLYFRIDIWENPLESEELSGQDVVMLDSTLASVSDRLGGVLLYAEDIKRNAWPARLARYDLGHLNRQAKVLLVKRLRRYYLLTVISNSSSRHHKSINRFIHSFHLFE